MLTNRSAPIADPISYSPVDQSVRMDQWYGARITEKRAMHMVEVIRKSSPQKPRMFAATNLSAVQYTDYFWCDPRAADSDKAQLQWWAGLDPEPKEQT